MFHPLGSQPPAVYWRRRLVLLASLVLLLVLVALTINAATSSGSGAAAASNSHHPASPPTSPSTSPSTTPVRSPTAGTSSSSGPSSAMPPGSTKASGTASGTASSTSVAPPPRCTAGQLRIEAVSGKSTYHVGDHPLLELQVLDTATKPCVQDLADRQVELRVYNGESRVWGSHDCQTEPGTMLRTLTPDVPVRVAITWSGQTSQPACKPGTRQQVGAGTYTLYAVLSGHTGRASQFTIS